MFEESRHKDLYSWEDLKNELRIYSEGDREVERLLEYLDRTKRYPWWVLWYESFTDFFERLSWKLKKLFW